jgi:DNA-binding XRE family transcriptional regulator
VGRVSGAEIGDLLKQWRARRHLSQMTLAHEVDVSPKHLSFIETGRSRPSVEMVLTLARHLDVPLREQNDLLLAAGFAPRFSETSLDDPHMAQVLKSLQRLLDTHEPYPGLALDRHWNVILANSAATPLAALLPASLATPAMNVFRASLHPDGLAQYTRNFPAWAGYLRSKLRRLVMITGDSELAAIEAEVNTYPNVVGLTAAPDTQRGSAPGDLLVPFELSIGGHDLSMFTTLTTFGTPRDVTLDDLAIELFFPTDSTTEQFFTKTQQRKATR